MRIFALCLLAAACAGPTSPSGLATQRSQLIAGAAVAAPEGLVDYCVRRPSECGASGPSDLRGRMPATGAASFQDASWVNAGAAQASVFQAMMAARLARPEPAAFAHREEMALTPARWRELQTVNRDINRRIIPTTDRALYGVEEHWDRPLVSQPPGVARGDCEDYALEKRARLIALGWSPDMVSIAVAVVPRIGLHATLIAQTDQGDFVLDNLASQPQPVARLDYVWISRQAGGELGRWAAAQIVGAPTPRRSFADTSAEGMFQRLMLEHARPRLIEASQSELPIATLLATPTPVLVKAPEQVRPASEPSVPHRPAPLRSTIEVRFGPWCIEP